MDLNGTTIVVTGGTGFLGRHVCNDLEKVGATVEPVGRDRCDLRHRVEINRMLADIRPDAVVHLAAVVGGIGANRAHPGQFLYENAIMGLELLEACRVAGVAKTVIAGTVCAYPKHTPVPFREECLWDGYPEETNAPYGLAKKLLLAQAQAYRAEYGMNVVYLLPANLYGPGDNFDLETGHVIPAMIRKFIDANQNDASEVVLWGDGSPTREFLYVQDAAHAFRLALERYDGPEPLNLGSGQEISIKDLAALIAKTIGYQGDIVWNPVHPNGQPRRCLDPTNTLHLMGFEAGVRLREGVSRTVSWYIEHRLQRPVSSPHRHVRKG
jgi:GDP-L-fucose synthase